MQISIDTSTASAAELTALIALLASLGGRSPVTVHDGVTWVESVIQEETTKLILATAGDPPLPSEQLLAAAASTARPAPPPPADDEDEGAADLTALDKSGVPWDERIHSSSKSINKSDGMWRTKRGVGEVEFGKIHAELQALHARPNAQHLQSGDGSTGTDTPAGNSAPPPPPEDDDSPNAQSEPLPAVAAGESARTDPPAAANAAAGGRFADFAAFVQAVNAIKTPALTYVELASFSQMFGAPAFKDMKDKRESWEDFYVTAGGQ